MSDHRVGYVNSWSDPIDGKIRAANFTISDRQLAGLGSYPGEEVFESLAARALQEIGYGKNVPRDQRGHAIRFSANDAYKPRSLYEVFDSNLWRANFKGGAFFRDKVIIIGAASQIAHDVLPTPINPEMPGPVLHLQTMAAAMQGQFLHSTSKSVAYALVFAAGVFAWMLIAFVRQSLITLACLAGITIAYLAATRIIYDQTGLLLLTTPALAVFLLARVVLVRLEGAVIEAGEKREG